MIHKDFNCEIYFIRHGQSESNATPGIAAGINFDAPLTKLGHHQAKLLGERFKSDGINFDKIYCSTLIRAIQTTENMLMGMDNSNQPVLKVADIIEQQIPGWRGVPVECPTGRNPYSGPRPQPSTPRCRYAIRACCC